MPGKPHKPAHKPAGSPADANGHGTGGQFDHNALAQSVVAIPAKSKDAAERLSSLASSLRGRAAYRDFLITNTDSELSINTSYYLLDPYYGYPREITQSLSIRPNGDKFSAEAFVYTEDEDEADESSYQSDLLASIKTDEDALRIAQDYMATIHQEMEDSIKRGTASLDRREMETHETPLAVEEKTREQYRAEYAAQYGEAHAARLYGPAPRVAGQPQSEIKYYNKSEVPGTNAIIGETWANDAVLESDGEVVAAVIGINRLELADNWNSSPERIEGVRQLIREFGINASMSADTWEWLTKDATHEEMNQTFERAGMGKITSDDLHDMINARAAKSAWEHGAYSPGE